MATRRSIATALGVSLLAIALLTIVIPTYNNFNYPPSNSYTYNVVILRGNRTALTIENNEIMLIIAYNESVGSASGVLMSNLFVGKPEKAYISFTSSFCAARPVPIPQASEPSNEPATSSISAEASPLYITPAPPPPQPPPPPPQPPIHLPPLPPPPLPPLGRYMSFTGFMVLEVSFIPVTPTSGAVNVTVPLLPCLPITGSVTLMPGVYNVTVKFVWILTGAFYGLNGALHIDLAQANPITPLPTPAPTSP
ncbi:MAG: hypothetical protein RXO24_00845 [Acidilobus sp.]